MLLLRRLTSGGVGRSRLLRARQSSPLSSTSTATAQSSSWSPLWPPDPDAGGPDAGHRRLHPDGFEYDRSKARMLDMPSPFVRAGQDPGAPIKVVVVSNHLDACYWSEQLAAAIQDDNGVPRVLGLDVEWKPTFKRRRAERRAAVLQISGPGLCLVIQLFKLNGQLPRSLRQMLRNPKLLKVGVSINSDLAKLRQDWGLLSTGSHDVGLAGGRIVHGHPFRMCSVASMAEAIWGVELEKGKSVRLSNWEAPRLSEDQVWYAALDAVAGREIYLELHRRRQLPGDEALEGMMSQWLLSGEPDDWRKARSLAVERDSLRRLYRIGTGKSCFQRFPPIVKDAADGLRASVAARLAAAAATAEGRVEREVDGLDGLEDEDDERPPRVIIVKAAAVEEEEEEDAVLSVEWPDDNGPARGRRS